MISPEKIDHYPLNPQRDHQTAPHAIHKKLRIPPAGFEPASPAIPTQVSWFQGSADLIKSVRLT